MSCANYKPMKGKLSGSFGFKTDTNGEVINRKRVTCFICEKSFTYCGSVSSLQYHLRKMHNVESSRLTAQEPGADGTAPPAISSAKEAELISKVAIWLVSSLRPPSLVEDSGLSDVLRMALNCPTYSLPSRYIVSSYINQMYEVEKFCIKEKMYRAKFISLTGDKWTSAADEPYIAITAHWIDDEWQLRNSILQVELVSGEHQSGGYINQFKQVAQEWGIEGKVVAICMDNDYNINDVIDDLNYPYLRCIAHTLKLAFTRALATVPGDVISNCVNILSHFKENLEFQLDARINYPSILNHNVNNLWNSTHIVLDSMLKMKETIDALSDDNNPSSINTLTETEWEIVENLAECLKPCADITELLGGSGYVTASIVVPAVQHLKNLMKVSLLEAAYISTFKKTFVDHLCTQMAVWDRFDMYEEATALDPRFKYLKCLPEANRETVWMRFKDNTVNLDDIKVEDPPKKKFKLLLEEPSRSGTHETEPTSSVTNSIDLELSIYRSLKELDNDFSNPLEWWKMHSLQLPGLATLAQEKLCVPATSVPIERLFSVAGFTDNVQRAILDPTDVNMMICLRSWVQ